METREREKGESERVVCWVDGPLSVTLDPARDRVAVPAGELLPTITCSALCNPGCSYSWVKDDASEPLTRGRTLTLDRVTQSSAGIYKCVATNPHGMANKKFELAVQCKLLPSSRLLGLFNIFFALYYTRARSVTTQRCFTGKLYCFPPVGPSSTITLSPAKDVHDVAEGGNLTVTCSATCDPPCSFRWRNSTGQTVAGDATLRLTTLRTDNSGKYTCVADNKIGTPAERNCSSRVAVGPTGRITISPPGPTVTLKQGHSVVLSCSAGCSPSCTYQWTKGAQVLSSANGILTLNDVSRQQDGVYSCQATNSAEKELRK
ncbi:hypothetical protein C0Q70_12674 [Pomacea canaliculata]|uniref:Ig-like domain-containing protein n=1 Tax=Pomacea canaliculata TaxID=400727 RepID=A0A2T7P262_POMCA|nr:hypothetical protein C0Q70_12674 [Pomacea canaliculata]